MTKSTIESLLEGDVSDLYDSIPDDEILRALRMTVTEDLLSKNVEELPTNDGVLRLQFYCEKIFVWFVARLSHISSPIFKVVMPCLGHTGANYYVVWGQKSDGTEVIAFFRGTYGYGGTGPHQSAFVEKFFKMFGYRVETRCGDYLLSLLKL